MLKLTVLQVLQVQKEEHRVLPSCPLFARFLCFVKDSFLFSSLSLLAKCPLGSYLVIRSVERFTERNKRTDGVANTEHLWGLKLDTQVSSSEWQLWHHTSTGLYLQALVSGFSETLPLNSALGMLIVSLSLKFVTSVSWPYLFTHILLYLSLIHAAKYSCLLVALKRFCCLVEATNFFSLHSSDIKGVPKGKISFRVPVNV